MEVIPAIILAGGLSRRMGGKEKSFVRLDGRFLIDHTIARLKKQTDAIVINANGDPDRFSYTNLPVIGDRIEGFLGPLAGILTGLVYAQENFPQASHIMVVAADTPFFPDNLLTRFCNAIEASNKNHDRIIAIASSDGNEDSTSKRHLQPVFGLWPLALVPVLDAYLSRGENPKVMAFVKRHDWIEVGFKNKDGIDPFFNINTFDDLEQAKQLIASTFAEQAS